MNYNILFKSLKEGNHSFEYKISNTFFTLFPESEIEEGNLDVSIDVIKRTRGLEITFGISGEVGVECDRCLESFMHPVDTTQKLFFEFSDESREVTDELVYISESEDYLDISSYIYEFALLSLPFQRFHPDDEEGNSLCNEEMLKKLEKLSFNNEEKDDPRWDKLRGLIN
jgi:uncharacterized metal-binding protein YceD (DUF177 family)